MGSDDECHLLRSDQCLTASRMLRLDDNAEEEGSLDAALFFTCRLPGIVIGPSTDAGSNRQTIRSSAATNQQPECITFHYKKLGAYPFLLASVLTESASNEVKRMA